jgi:hypothetical protein
MSIERLWKHGRARGLGVVTFGFALVASVEPLTAQGTLRELLCRGNTGLLLQVDQDPSPRDSADVVMSLTYKRPSTAPGNDARNLEPGSCTWNPLGLAGEPPEPGRVRFDVRREAQPWSSTRTRTMDTTAGAARFFPDPISLPRYLRDPRHYWKFFVDDRTNVSTSFGQMFDDGLPTYVTVTGPVILANDVQRDLICRGGSAGFRFGGGTNAGNGLLKSILTYRVSRAVPGPAGYGVSPGSCAWTDRVAMPPEPGTIAFITPRNAQLKQMQSGGAVDRSPTAAERWPDVSTIPAYLANPSHYWRFTVVSRDPDSAITHGAWKRDLTNVVATGRSSATSVFRSQPNSVPGGGVFRPGGAGSSSSAQAAFDIRNVVVTPSLEGVVMKFDAAANVTPTVTITPPASGGTPLQLAVGSYPGTRAMRRYTASNNVKLARDARYTYVISAPASGNARANQKTGAFATFRQDVSIVISQIYLVSDGDAEGDGELIFSFEPCTQTISSYYLSEPEGKPLSWGDGPHPTTVKMTSTATVPDRFQLLVFGREDDGEDFVPDSRRRAPRLSCSRLEPATGKATDEEWNTLLLDFDLTKYPGAKGGEQFVRRSKPLRDGSTLSFEIRGSILVTRQ